MARTNNLTNFLTDVATAIKVKKGDSTPIQASSFDTEINNFVGRVVIPNGMIFRYSTFTTLPTWLENADYSNITDASYMFSNCTNLTTVPTMNLDKTKVTTIYSLFYSCKSFTSISNLDFSGIPNKGALFSSCTNLTTVSNINLSGSDSNTNSVFGSCTNLTTVSNINASNSSLLYLWFSGCTSLTTITNFNTTGCTNIYRIFDSCTSLETAPAMDTSSANGNYGLTQAFRKCTNLKNVPIYNTTNVLKMTNMFDQCPNLTNQSLDNILQMCINATSYAGTKTLASLGITTTNYPASRIQALPHYQAFINAGWTIS